MAEQRSIKDLQNLISGWDKNEILASYLNPDDVDVSEEPYEEALRKMMSDPEAIKALLASGNKAFLKKYAKSLLKDKGIFDLYDMNMDNITESIKDVSGSDDFKKEDILNQAEPYLKMDGATLKAIAKVNGWDFQDMLKLIQEEQTKQGRKNVYDESLVARTVFPRVSKAMMEKGDYDWQDMTLDIGENVLQAMPLAGAGTKVATIGLRSGLTGAKPFLAGVGGSAIENALVPATMAAADEFRKDDGSFGDFLANAAQGAMINAVAGKMVNSALGSITANPRTAAKIKEMLDTGDNALKTKLEGIYKVLKDPNIRRRDPEEVKRANNELALLVRQAEFTNKGILKSRNPLARDVNIADYATMNSKARKVGKQARDIYEGELIANKGQPWVAKVRKNEARYEPGSAYFTNREAVFPHMFVNQKRVGSQSGLLKTPGRHNLDQPEFRNFNWNDLEHENLVKNQIDKMFDKHHSKTFHYDIDFDKIVDDVLKDPVMVKAIARAYGGVNPREAVISYITNKLGRSEWLRDIEQNAARTFGEFSGLKKYDKKEKE